MRRRKSKCKKATIVCAVVATSLLLCGFTGYKYYYPRIEVNESPLVIEYNKNEDYKKIVQLNSNATENKISWDEDNIVVGEYTVQAVKRGTNINYSVKVVDTTQPTVVSKVDPLEFENGIASKEDILKSVDISDESEYTVDVVMPEGFINTKAGCYTADLSATDIYGNCTKVEIPFIVNEKKTSNTDNAIEIKDVGVYAYLNTGTGQEEVDEKGYDGTILTQLNMPGSGEPILVAGHNNREFKDLHSVEVGDDITLYYEGYEYEYEVIYSDICSTTGPDLTDKDTGEDELEYSGRDILQMYTCYKVYADNERWVVKAVRQ